MKKILGFFCLVASLASCDVTIDSHEPVNGADSSAIGFNVYVNRGVTTKAGYKGDLTTAKLENEAGGFGVFAYYGDGALYNETSKPDFMYNQPVTYNPTYEVWDYKPVKYWPNEYGTAAGSQSADRLTFFAYAPYVDVTPSTGIVKEEGETGILGMTRNIAPGDPMVRYGANFKPGQGVDLCWGVAKEAFTSSVDGNSNDVKAGEPFLNVVKPKTGDRLKFDFNHALTQLNVTVDADIDVENGETGTLATETKIYVRSVTFTGFTARGSLNLNSKAGNPAWFDMSGTGRVNRDPVTIYDGRSDGMEGVPTATDVNELPHGLNPKIIQTGEATVGVTNEKVNLFDSNDDDAPIMVIPVAGVPMTVTIVYDIETEDPSLGSFLSDGSTHGISIENKITRSIKMNSADLTLVSGRKYTINLHLGLTSVKFDATVGGWDDSHSSGSGDAPISTTTLVSVSVDPTSATVETGETVATPTVTATGSDCDLTNDPNVAWSWSSGTGNVATVDATTGAITLTGTTGTEIITVSATYKGITKSAEFTVTVNDPTPAPVVPGTSWALFSVSDTKQVYIATSNLMWRGTTLNGSYSLMANPWSVVETGNLPTTGYGVTEENSGEVGLFGWGTPDIPYLNSYDEDDYSVDFIDWGTRYGDGNWRCLTNDEWAYLIMRSVGSFTRGYGMATVNEMKGMILIPDDFSTPSGINYTAGNGNGYETNVFSSTEWALMQRAGAVFLPAAGFRSGNTVQLNYLRYWSGSDSTVDYLTYDDGFYIESDGDKSCGYAVRLVYDKE